MSNKKQNIVKKTTNFKISKKVKIFKASHVT